MHPITAPQALTAQTAPPPPSQPAPRLWPFGRLTPQQQRDRARLERRLKLDALVRYPEALW